MQVKVFLKCWIKKTAKEQGPKRYIIKSFYVMQHKKFSHTLKNSASLVEYNAT